MKKLSISTLAIIATLVAASAAQAANTTPGWYAGAGVGASFGVDPTLRSAAGNVDAKYKGVNADLLGDAGYAWSNGLRLEGELFHNQNNIDSVSGQSGAGGHITNNALFANVLYDFQNNSMFTPYIGAGVGPDFINVKSVGANGTGFLQGDTLDGAYQAIAGVSAQLDKNWAVTADYRYIASFDPKVDHAGTGGGQGRMDNASHNLILGLRYDFGTPAAVVAETPVAPVKTAAAPMMVPRAAAKAVVAPIPQSFMVFFDFNKSTLTPEAKRIIASAAKEYKAGHFVKIAVTGHTDTVGSVAYNQKLSEKRAAAVQAELVSQGVTKDSIKEQGVGKNDLMVPTADGVREAQNRRAEIVLTK